MRIAMFHELPKGGARRAVNELAKHLKKNNTVDLYIVDEKNDKNESKFFSNTYFFSFIPKTWKGKNWKVRLYKDTIELLKLYRLHKSIAKVIYTKKYDIVFVHSSKFTEAPFLLRFPNTTKIFYCHDPHYRMLYEDFLGIPKNIDPLRKTYERINRQVRKRIDKKNITSADIVLANSEYTKKGVRRAYGITSTVCYLGVDTNKFKPRKIKKTLDLFYVGSREQVDGYPLLQEILKRLKKEIQIKAVLVEDEWIADDTVLRDYYCKAKITLCLSVGEPLGLVPLEAMACGTPVIATNDAGHKETVQDGKTGILVKSDPYLIAQKISQLLNKPGLLSRMGTNARTYTVTFWTWEKAAERVEKVFKNVINKSS